MISRSNVDGGHDVDGLTRGRIKHSPTNSIPSKKREIMIEVFAKVLGSLQLIFTARQ